MFCPDGEVIVIHSKQVDKTGPSTLILASTRGLIKEYLRWLIHSVNPEFAPSHSPK